MNGPPIPSPTRKRRKSPSKPRPRDAIVDALALAEDSDPLQVPSSHMRTLCVKASELRQIAPEVTPDEVVRRAANWDSHMGEATITGPAVVKWWARLDQPARRRIGTDHPIDRMARDLTGGGADGQRPSSSASPASPRQLPRVAGQ